MAAWLREAIVSTAVACASLTADPSAAQTAAAAPSQNGARFAVVRAPAAGVPVLARGSALGQIPSEAIVVATGRVRRGARVVWREVIYGELIGWVDARHLAPYPDGVRPVPQPRNAPSPSAGSSGAAPAAALAESPSTQVESVQASESRTTTATGYLDTRFRFDHVRIDRPVAADGTPALRSLTEANLQLRLRWGETATALVDASLFHQQVGLYYEENAAGARARVPAVDQPRYRSGTVLSEAYFSGNLGDHANVTLGKKRVVWGPGMAVNPSDILNPPKDPTDPVRQRVGAWIARLEFPHDTFTVTLLGAAKVLREYGGVPTALIYYPSWGRSAPGDAAAHYAAAARVYALVADTDLQAYYYYTHFYEDAFRHKSRYGVSASRLIGDALEVHTETLAWQGSSRVYPDEACLAQAPARDYGSNCRRKLGDAGLTVRALIGARYQFEAGDTLSAEYLYLGDGYDRAEFSRFVGFLERARQSELSSDSSAPALGDPEDAGSPATLGFEPLRSHYLFLGYDRPYIYDDFAVNVLAVASLDDLSGQLIPSATWSVREWLSIDLTLSIPWPPSVAAARASDGSTYSEFELAPIDWSAFVSARLFY